MKLVTVRKSVGLCIFISPLWWLSIHCAFCAFCSLHTYTYTLSCHPTFCCMPGRHYTESTNSWWGVHNIYQMLSTIMSQKSHTFSLLCQQCQYSSIPEHMYIYMYIPLSKARDCITPTYSSDHEIRFLCHTVVEMEGLGMIAIICTINFIIKWGLWYIYTICN